ncbi:MAG: CapA family protein [Spirochaetales bacterium]|nr:CapA family protein [Spirochaetales bacterium]
MIFFKQPKLSPPRLPSGIKKLIAKVLIGIFLIFIIPGALLSAQNSHDLSSSGINASDIQKEELILTFTGDLMAHSINYRMTDYSDIYARVKDIFLKDDLTFTNAEFPMDPEKPMASFPSFNIHPIYLRAFVDAGLDAFSIANNHSGDIGLESLKATFRAAGTLAEDVRNELNRELYYSGVSDVPQDEYTITEINKNGWKIGFLAVTQKSNNPMDSRYLYQVDYNKREERESFLQWLAVKTDAYDLFIISYHGGVEYNFIPVQPKRDFFHALLDAGVDIVWGQHPHVIQEIEVVESKTSQGVILYSLGNFLSGQGRIIDEVLPEEEWSYTGDSAAIQLVIGALGTQETMDDSSLQSKRGGISVRNIIPIPMANYITPNREVIIYPLEDLVLHPLPSPWDEFYRVRSRIMSGYFRNNIKRVSSQKRN